MADRVGQRLGNYHLLRLLGRGGFAEVYLGEHIYLNSQAALKILLMSLRDDDIDQFTTEARTLAGLNHPHIIRVLDYSVENGMPFLVMEYAANGTLRQRYPLGERLPTEIIVLNIRQIASALQYAHDQRLVHRDVKPENFLLGANDEVLLSDFGLAILSSPVINGDTQSTRTIDSTPPLVGTMSYIAPEQLRGQAQPASDQYSLGIVVYEWLSGKRPFEGSQFEVAIQHISAQPRPLREQVLGISPAIEEVVLRSLAKAPQERFSSVQDFASALERAYQYTLLPPSTFAPFQVGEALRHELKPEPMWKVPTAFTPLIGRDQEVAEICALLKHPDVRLVTLLGTGGIGKTRLVYQVAREMQPYFADGICCVLLGSVNKADLVIPYIAQVLGIQEQGGQPILERIKVWLRNKHFLLLLDNFEQVVEIAPMIEELLAACPRLKVGVTSREALHLDAEHIYQVPPLDLPGNLNALQADESLARYAAIALFIQRAQAIAPSFHLGADNARSVAEICMRLDGLPLAIELAAARMNILSPEALLAKLSEPFKSIETLTSRSRTLSSRQQTLRNALQWSYDLLNAEEQRLFRRLSVFLGGWTLEAIDAIQSALHEKYSISTLDLLSSLLDKSLLVRSKQEGTELRLLMLLTVREYALDLLRESGEIELIRRAHASYFLALAEDADHHLRGPEQIDWLAKLEVDQENIRVALAWYMEQGEADLALRLSGAMGWFWYLHGYWSEGRRWLASILGLAQAEEATAERAHALFMAGTLAFYQDDYILARPLLEESSQIYKKLDLQREYSNVLGALGQLIYLQGDFATAWTMLKESEALCRSLGSDWELASVLRRLGYVMLGQNDLAEAATYAQEGLAHARGLGDKYLLAMLLLTLGDIAASQNNLERAVELDQEGLNLARELGHKSLISIAVQNLGYLVAQQGNLAQAMLRTQEGLKLARELGDRISITATLHTLGFLAAQRNDIARASEYYHEGLAVAREIGNEQEIGLHLIGLAEVAMAEERPRQAARLFGAAEKVLDTEADLNVNERAAYERGIEKVRGILGEETFATLRIEGGAMTPEEALAAPEEAPARGTMVPRQTSPITAPSYPDGLTHREVEILRLLATGHTVAQIAGQLVISQRTVTTHITSIYRKIKVNSRSAATRYAIAHKLIN